MPKNNYMFSMDTELHKKMKLYAASGEITLGDLIGLMCHFAENSVDLERVNNPDQKPKTGKFNSMAYRLHELTMQKQNAIYDNPEIKEVPRPFLGFGKKVEDIRP